MRVKGGMGRTAPKVEIRRFELILPLGRALSMRKYKIVTVITTLIIAATLAASAQARSHHAADIRQWTCIHQHEGAWNDAGGPYWGGLQMDLLFQEEYGPEFLHRWGTADNWPIWAQLEAARRARDGWENPYRWYYTQRHYDPRGYEPWPTARWCGLN